MIIKKFFILVLVLPLLTLSCGRQSGSNISMGKYRTVLKTAGGDLPFFFELKNDKGVYTASLLNGKETVKIDEVNITGDSLTLYLPSFNSTIKAVKSGSLLHGNLTLVKANAVKQVIPLAAELNTSYRFFIKPENSIDVSGRWAAVFREDDGSTYPAIGEFIQKGSELTGTFLTTTGDYRYLEGQVKDRTIYLSTFDGAHAYLFRATLDKNNKLEGGYWSGPKYHESWSAVKNENAKLPDPDKLTFLKKGYSKFDFSFLDLNRKTVSLSDKKFKGKVVIVTLEGSWCPNCHDESRFLSSLYDKYHNQGLKIISLMFENYNDTVKAISQIKKFRKEFNIKYDLLLAGTNDKGLASKKLPMLNKVLAFPTTIFIDRKGRVRKIYTGFSGPGTGDHYIHLTDEFTGFTEKLLHEK